VARVSVVVPVYNGEQYLAEALASVRTQTYRDYELIVVDDGSTDRSPEILSAFADQHSAVILTQGNKGQSAARNAGAAMASGEYLAFLDQDDRWYPRKLERQVMVLDRSRDVGLVYSDLDEIDEAGRIITHQVLRYHERLHPKRSLLDCLVEDMFILPSSVIVRRDVFGRAGGFDERLSGYEDDDLFLRIFHLAKLYFIRAALVQWRVYAGSSSHYGRMGESRTRFFKKLLEAYPDQPGIHKYFTSAGILPRFTDVYASLYVANHRKGASAAAATYKKEFLELVAPHLGWSGRALVALRFAPWPLYRMLSSIRRLFFPRASDGGVRGSGGRRSERDRQR
jgi:glycosyltransferase involved in cell wall biosynthesis